MVYAGVSRQVIAQSATVSGYGPRSRLAHQPPARRALVAGAATPATLNHAAGAPGPHPPDAGRASARLDLESEAGQAGDDRLRRAVVVFDHQLHDGRHQRLVRHVVDQDLELAALTVDLARDRGPRMLLRGAPQHVR